MGNSFFRDEYLRGQNPLGWICSVVQLRWEVSLMVSAITMYHHVSGFQGPYSLPKEPSRHLWQETNYRPRVQMFSVFFSVLPSFCLSNITRRGSLLLFYVCSKPNFKALTRALFVCFPFFFTASCDVFSPRGHRWKKRLQLVSKLLLYWRTDTDHFLKQNYKYPGSNNKCTFCKITPFCLCGL